MGIPHSTSAVSFNDVDYVIKQLTNCLEDARYSLFFREQIQERWDHTVDQLLQLNKLEEALPRLSLLYQRIKLFV